MTDQHPIIPPPELLQQWLTEFYGTYVVPGEACTDLATRSAQWGADQELEACCDWVSWWRCMVGGNRPEVGLRAFRRPKPPSLKEQALLVLDDANLDAAHHNILLRALEQLDD